MVRATGWKQRCNGIARWTRASWAALALLSTTVAAAAPADDEVVDLGMEQLLNLPVSAASKFPQKLSEAPANVTVVTSADIAAYGYRTLTDILNSVPGLYVFTDHNYDFVGVRGLARSGDFNGRVLTVIDGYRANEPVYGAAGIGTEFMIDVDLIDRVEFVPGPGSSIYGSNAFFGVINVITKKGRHLKGLVGSAQGGTQQTDKARASYGERFANGLDMLISGTRYARGGEDYYFPALNAPATNYGWSRGLDADAYQSALLKADWRGLAFEAGWVERPKAIPTGAYGCVFGDPRCRTVDRQYFSQLAYDTAVGDINLQARAYRGRYDYWADYPYDDGSGNVIVNHDGSQAAWWGGELKAIGAWERHKAIGGFEYTRDDRVNQYNYDADPFQQYADDRRSRKVFGVYLQDEFRLHPRLTLNTGVRRDDLDEYGGATSPRVALIARAAPDSTVKLAYGTAFRAPNAFESYYVMPGNQKDNPNLRPETTRNYDLIFEQLDEGRWRWSASAFHYSIEGMITQVVDPADSLLVFKNVNRAAANGGTLAGELLWTPGVRSRASWSWQRVIDRDTHQRFTNSPQHVGKLALSAPMPMPGLTTGLELLYTGARLNDAGSSGGYAVTNLTLGSEGLVKGLSVIASAYNLFNRSYGLIAPETLVDNGIHALAGEARGLQLKVQYTY